MPGENTPCRRYPTSERVSVTLTSMVGNAWHLCQISMQMLEAQVEIGEGEIEAMGARSSQVRSGTDSSLRETKNFASLKF
jgi:hypothetical protein